MRLKKAAFDVQDELEAVHQHLTQQQRSNLAKMEKQGWEAADWKARALESTQKLAAANAQVSVGSCSLHVMQPALCLLQYVCLLLSQLSAASCWGFLPGCCRLASTCDAGLVMNFANAAVYVQLAIVCPPVILPQKLSLDVTTCVWSLYVFDYQLSYYSLFCLAQQLSAYCHSICLGEILAASDPWWQQVAEASGHKAPLIAAIALAATSHPINCTMIAFCHCSSDSTLSLPQ